MRIKIKRSVSILLTIMLIISSVFTGAGFSTLAKDYEGEGTKINEEAKNDQWLERVERAGYSSWNGKALEATEPEYGYRFQKDNTDPVVKKGTEFTGELPDSEDGSGKKEKQEKGDYVWFYTGNSANKVDNIVVRYEDRTIVQKDPSDRVVTRKVDIRCTVTGIDKVNGDEGYIGIGNDVFDLKYIHLGEVSVKYEFFNAESGEPISIYTNITLVDIDNNQYVGFSKDSLRGTYVDRNTHLKWYRDEDRDLYLSEYKSATSGDAEYAVGFMFYDDCIEYTFGKYPTDEHPLDNNYTIQYVGSGQSMVKYPVADPVKTVSDNTPYISGDKATDEVNVGMNHLKNAKEHWTYTIMQPIPTKLAPNQYYSNFEYHDAVDTCLTIDSVEIYHGLSGTGDGKNVSEWFSINISSNNEVTAALKNSFFDDFYQKHDVYRMVIKVHLAGTDNWDSLSESEKTALEKKWLAHHEYSERTMTIRIDNTASTVIDRETHPTNETGTYLVLNPNPEKNVSDGSEYNKAPEIKITTNHCRNVMENWTYRVSQGVSVRMKNIGGYNHFELIDEIEECMQINSVKVEKVLYSWEDGAEQSSTDVSSWFNITTTNNKVSANLKDVTNKDFYESENANLKYELVINVSLKGVDNWDLMTDEEKTVLENVWRAHGHYNETETMLTFNNVAQRNIDGDVRTSDKTTTIIELSENEENVPGLAITKDVNRYEHQVGDIVHYTVKVWNTNEQADTAGFKIWDTSLPDTMSLDMDSVKIDGISSENYVLEQYGNGWMLKSKGKYALPYGTVITITYDAEALVASNGTLVDNTASATAIGIPEKSDSEQIYINSPKLNVEKTAPQTKYKVGDTVGYRAVITNINPGTFMRDIKLNDMINTPGLEIKEGSVAVLVEGRDMTSSLDITYNDDSTGFEIKTPFNLKNGEIPCIENSPYSTIQNWCDKIIVTYDATITEKAEGQNSLDNTFNAPATENTNGDVIKDDNTIPSGGASDNESVGMKTPALDIVKASDKTNYNVGESGKYTLTVKQMRENLVAKNVVIEDSFAEENGLVIDRESIVVTYNEKDITKECVITSGDRNFKIETGKNLTDEDVIKVTYSVVFSIPGSYTNVAVASSDNTGKVQDSNVVEVVGEFYDTDVYKNAGQKKYKVGDYVTYTVNVSLHEEDAMSGNVVIEDHLPEELKLDEKSVNISGITDFTTEIQNNTLKVMIPKLTYGQKVVVTYKALVLPQAAGKTLVNKAGVNGDTLNPGESEVSVEIEKQEKVTTPEKMTKAPKEKKEVITTTTSPKTGDLANIAMYIVIALVAFAGIVVIMVKKRKLNK